MNKETQGFGIPLNTIELILIIWRKRILLFIIGFISFAAGIFISLQLTLTYKSQAILYAEPNTSHSKYVMTRGYNPKIGLYSFGDDEDAEKLLQIISSNTVADIIIDRYNLLEHYRVENKKHKYYEAKKIYDANFLFRRTKYNSVIIEVIDEDPQMAADMANEILGLIDSLTNSIVQQRSAKTLAFIQMELERAQLRVDRIRDSMNTLSERGIIDVEAQIERLQEAYAYAVKEGNMNGASRLKKEIEKVGKGAAQSMVLRTELEYYQSELSLINQRYVEARLDSESSIPRKYVIDYAKVADKKYKPKRSVVALAITFSSVLLTILIILVLEIKRKIQDKI